MTHPRTRTRALVVGVIALGAIGLTGCNFEQQIMFRQAVQADTFMKVAATRRPGAPSDQTLAQLRACESHGNYGAVSSNGTYRGAYQFSRRTWNNVAGTVLPLYLNTDPAVAPPHVQDAMARALWTMTGPRSWPICGPRAA